MILAIESSCDESSVALVEKGKTILACVTAGHEAYNRAFGGVVPEVSARRHLELLLPCLDECLNKAGLQRQQLSKIEAVAVTTHPGLIASLLVGVMMAKSLAYALKKPFIGISHLKAHFYSVSMSSDIQYPHIGLLVSGGHSILAKVKSPLDIEVLGYTLDDACGECFDKVARHLDLGYPGGPALEKLALTGREDFFIFPQPQLQEKKKTHFHSKTQQATQASKAGNTAVKNSLKFSYSGLKTAVLFQRQRFINKKYLGHNATKADIAASFQHAALKQLIEKTLVACQKTGLFEIGVAGGVAANLRLRSMFNEKFASLQTKQAKAEPSKKFRIHFPPLSLCSDNASMIAGLAHAYLQKGLIEKNYLELSPMALSFKKNKIL